MEVGHEPIVWSRALMTGVDVIDAQHLILVEMLNELNIKLTEGSGRIVFEDVVHDLMSYAVYHFDTEEELMVENSYTPEEFQLHLNEHRAFSQKVANLQQDLRQGTLISREDLLTFLNGWLINHILKTDMKLGEFLTGGS